MLTEAGSPTNFAGTGGFGGGADAGGHVALYSGWEASRVATGSVVMSPNSWNVYEFYLVTHATDGMWKIWANGIECVSYTGNTVIAGPGINYLVFTAKLNVPCYYDDIVVVDATGLNATRPKGLHLTYLKPTANVEAAWTPSTGSNYACIDEVPFSTTDYITAGSTYLVDTYEIENLPADAYAVKLVMPSTYGKAAGDFIGVDQLQVIAGTTHTGQLVQLGYETQSSQVVFNKNPLTGNDYTVEEINNMKLGLRSR
jgi:hypothetical protein